MDCSREKAEGSKSESRLKGDSSHTQTIGTDKQKPITSPTVFDPPFDVGSVFNPAICPVDVRSLSTRQIRQLYKDLLIQDQQYRDSIHVSGGSYQTRATQFRKHYQKADSVNQLILSALIHTYGWPRGEDYGAESVQAAFLISWHAPKEYKKQHLPFLLKAARRDTLNFHYYKILKDRLLIGDGKEQQFDTHQRLPNGEYWINF